jgi:hypothetical protein
VLRYIHSHNSEHTAVVGETALEYISKGTAVSKIIVQLQKQRKIGWAEQKRHRMEFWMYSYRLLDFGFLTSMALDLER